MDEDVQKRIQALEKIIKKEVCSKYRIEKIKLYSEEIDLLDKKTELCDSCRAYSEEKGKHYCAYQMFEKYNRLDNL